MNSEGELGTFGLTRENNFNLVSFLKELNPSNYGQEQPWDDFRTEEFLIGAIRWRNTEEASGFPVKQSFSPSIQNVLIISNVARCC